MPANPFGNTETTHVDENVESVDSLFDKEADLAGAKAIKKRNMAPAGTYITNPDDYPVTVIPVKVAEKDKAGDETGSTRATATIIARATATIKGEEAIALLRFSISPDRRPKKIYDGRDWTGEVNEQKDDLSSRLWADVTDMYAETHSTDAPPKQSDIVDYLRTFPVALRTMQGDDGLIVLGISARRGRRG